MALQKCKRQIRNNIYYNQNKEKSKKWRDSNKDKIRLTGKKSNEKNKEKIKLRMEI